LPGASTLATFQATRSFASIIDSSPKSRRVAVADDVLAARRQKMAAIEWNSNAHNALPSALGKAVGS
jgi:hypothetical protein